MIVDLTDVVCNEDKQYNIETLIELETFESRLGSYPIMNKTPLQLCIVNEEGQRLKITGTMELESLAPCDRCLTDVPMKFSLQIIREYTIEDKKLVIGMLEETDYMIGFDLDVEGLVYDEILTNWPMKVLCKDDCKGICIRCGTNLNLWECTCDQTEPDPRMAAIKDVFSKFKEV
ncbi:MAG: DUF177 domain-containing protein [Lachnospiraceae bacterium]